jgi:hypothetical protein
MGASQVPAGIASDNWVLISSVTPTAAATTVTFSGISGYKKLLFRSNAPTTAATSTMSLTFNGDTGAKYAIYSASFNGGSGAVLTAKREIAATAAAETTTVASGSFNMDLQIIDTNTTGVKNYSGYYSALVAGVTSTVFPSVLGRYYASAAISSVTLTTTSTYAGAGTVALYGVSE